MTLKICLRYGLLLALCFTAPARAALNIEIIGAGENQIPLSLAPLGGDPVLAKNILDVVSADLARSSLFRLIDPVNKAPHEPGEVVYADWAGVNALAIGSVDTQTAGRVTVKFRLLDTIRKTELVGQAISANKEQARAAAHHMADLIYEKLTGNPGVFSTRIAYVNRQKNNFRLVVADSDGYGEQTILSSTEPIMSPAWSPDGSHLAYVSFEHGQAQVFVQSLLTNQRQVVANFRGSNSAPAWSPDGRQLAVVLTRDGSSQIYLVRPDGGDLRRLTVSGVIDTEPSFSPDGQSLLFTSDRGGSPQIYRMSVNGGAAQRLTFGGGNHFSAHYSPDGNSFVFTHLEGGRFYVAVQDFASGQMQLLTRGGWDKKPSFAPNGKLVLFATEAGGRGILATVSSDGRVRQQMSSQAGDIREPVWGPLLK
jgi:TolB protein